MSLEFTLVRRAISLAVIDGPDADDNPDILQAQGSVLFEPVIKKGDSIQVQTRGGSQTYALAPIECPINDGIISHRGQDGVKLPAGGEAANPPLIRWKATFSRMQAGGKSFTLAPVIFDAVPGGEIDLTMVAPVAGAPEGVVRGPRGTSLESIIVDGSELVFTAVDDAGSFEIARIPLDDMVRAEAEAAADGVRDALAVDVAASQSARDAAEGHADRAATSESNAATSETNAKQSETNAGDYAAVATTAATEAVDAMERATDLAGGDFATREDVESAVTGKADKSYVDSSKWLQPQVALSVDLNTLTTPSVRILLSGVQPNKPFNGPGVLEVLPIVGGGALQRATNHGTLEVWKRRTVNRVFQAWEKELSKAEIVQKADKSYVDSVKWLQPQVPAGTDLNTLTTPNVRILLSGSLPNKPFAGHGVIEVLPIIGGGTLQRATDWATLEVWKRKTQGGAFQAWEKEPTNTSVTQLVAEALDSSPETSADWTRKLPLMVTTSSGSSNSSTGGDYRVRIQFTAPILRWRVHVSTAHPNLEEIRDATEISGVRVGTSLGGGEMESGEVLLEESTTVAGGGEWVSDWTRYDLRQDSLLALTVNPQGTHFDYLLAGWKEEGGAWTQKNRIPIWIWIEAETYSATPSVALIGDSTGAGHGSTEPVWDSAVAIAGRKQEFLPVLYASSGANLAHYSNPNQGLLKRWESFGRTDSAVIQSGSNDIHGGRTLTEMQSIFASVVPVAKKIGVKVYAATVKPRYPVGNMEDVRTAYNTWLKTLPAGIDGVIDYSGEVAPDGVILPEDNADGSHLNKSGHMKLAAAYSYPIARPRVAETWKP